MPHRISFAIAASNGMKITVLLFFLFLPLLFVGAQSAYPNPIKADTIQGILANLIDFAKAIIKPLAIIAVLYAAFLYVSAGGSEEKVSKAHRALTYGIIGLAIVLSAEFLKDVLGGVAGRAAGRTFAQFVESIARLFGLFIMAASVIAVVYSAFLFLTSGGDSDKVGTARQALLYAVIGVAVAVLAFAVPAVIEQAVPGNQIEQVTPVD